MTPLRRYRFTWDEVLSALQRRMHDADHADGVTLLTNADRTRSDKPLFHRIRAGDTLVIELFEKNPEPTPEPVLRWPGRTAPRKTVPLSRDPAGGA